ncbi:Scr1 family TA system antitoxin-like transcriptional regulator [Streptosporangium roseum]|nr:Scr1 family TA system antitoxin-like transcriptional regulator [Streptosporangium roseum]
MGVERDGLPDKRPPHAVFGSFRPADRAVVYVEYRQGALYLERQPDVDAHAKLFDHLRARALGPDESRALIARMAEEAL